MSRSTYRRVTVDLTMLASTSLSDEEVATLVEGAVRDLVQHGVHITSPRVRRVGSEA